MKLVLAILAGRLLYTEQAKTHQYFNDLNSNEKRNVFLKREKLSEVFAISTVW